MFFRHYWFYVLGLLPVHRRFPRYLRLVLGYYDDRDKLKEWHRAELEKLDPMFRLQRNSLRVVAAGEKALAQGIGPGDPKYPPFIDPQQKAEFLEAVGRLFEVSCRPVRPRRRFFP